MIVTTIRMQINPDNRNELVQTFRSLYEPILTESGCLSCRFYYEDGNDEAMMLIEEWQTEVDWKKHLQSREFAVLLGAMSLVKDPRVVELKVLSQMAGIESLKRIRANNNGNARRE